MHGARSQSRYREMSELITDLDRFARGDWINPLGRVRLQSYARLLIRRHPRKVFGIGIAIMVALVWWLVSSVLRWADSLRSSLDSRIYRVTPSVLNKLSVENARMSIRHLKIRSVLP